MTQRVPCSTCGTPILPGTAKVTGGVCMPCWKRANGIPFIVEGEGIVRYLEPGPASAAPARQDTGNNGLGRIVEAMEAGLGNSLRQFRSTYPDDPIYGVAMVTSVRGDYVFSAIASERGLERVARSYLAMGYRCQGREDLAALRTWLRWANPDDGWYQDTHGCFQATNELLEGGLRDGTLTECDVRVGELARDALRRTIPPLLGDHVVLATTCGEDPEEFLYWAKETSSPVAADRLAREVAAAREIEEAISR